MISVAAGGILDLLEQSGQPLSLEEVRVSLGEPLDVIYMSVGWLAREQYILLTKHDSKYYVSLLKQPVESFGHMKDHHYSY